MSRRRNTILGHVIVFWIITFLLLFVLITINRCVQERTDREHVNDLSKQDTTSVKN